MGLVHETICARSTLSCTRFLLRRQKFNIKQQKAMACVCAGEGGRGGLGIKICGFFSVCQGRSTNFFAKVRKSDSRDGSGLTKEYQKHR